MRLHESIDFRNKEKLNNFVHWWKSHTPQLMRDQIDTSNANFMKNITINENGLIDCNYEIEIIDHMATSLPFKFGKVQSMRLHMNRLSTLEGSPRECQVFTFESSSFTNTNLKSLVGIPEKVQYISLDFGSDLEDLKCGNNINAETIWINAPQVKSFTGFTAACTSLGLILRDQQQAISTIKMLRSIDNITLHLPEQFNGGLLSICLIPQLQSVCGGTPSIRSCLWGQALHVIDKGIKQKNNIHEIQEQLIDAGLSKFARL